MTTLAEQIGLARLKAVVARFYAQVRAHPRLAAPFARVHDWPEHLDHLSHFWWVSLGGARYLDYRYAVPAKHAAAGFTPALLDDWLALFAHTLTAELPPELAEPWLARAEKIGQSLRLMHELGHFAQAAPTAPLPTATES